MPGDTQQRIQKKFLRNKHNGRQEIDLYMKKKKISLRKIILLLMNTRMSDECSCYYTDLLFLPAADESE